MTIDLIGLARLSHMRTLTEVLEAVYGGSLPPARATLPELARDLAAAGVPQDAQPVVVVEDQTQPNPVARGRCGDVRNGVGGECHGMFLRAPAGRLVTVTRLTFESPDPSADIAIFGNPLRGMQNVPGWTSSMLGGLSLTVAHVAANVGSATVAAPIVGLGVKMPFGLEEPLVLRGHAEFDTSGETLIVFARTPNVEVRWVVEWSEEPAGPGQVLT